MDFFFFLLSGKLFVMILLLSFFISFTELYTELAGLGFFFLCDSSDLLVLLFSVDDCLVTSLSCLVGSTLL